MKKKKPSRILFSIKQIKTEQFGCFGAAPTQNKLQVQTQLKFGIDPLKRMLAVFSKFEFEHESNPVAMMEIFCAFEIQKNSWQEWVQSGNVTIPKTFMKHLSIITIGCARGAFHAKTEGTPFNSLIIPTVNLSTLIKEDLQVQSKENK